MSEVSRGAPEHGPDGARRGLRRLLHRWTSSRAELEAEELQEDAEEAGATPIASCGERQRAAVCGTVRTVTLRPRSGVPCLEADLYDGSDMVTLVWLGRRRIGGIEPGRMLLAEGLVSVQNGRKVMFNPRYQLRPVGGA
ncbi:MAG: DNA-binding protein [Streptosporangiales bacterium]|nr:DNA-binding protein [Streptosporangiales bacterium]